MDVGCAHQLFEHCFEMMLKLVSSSTDFDGPVRGFSLTSSEGERRQDGSTAVGVCSQDMIA